MTATADAPLLVTGFEPFGTVQRNPSADIVAALHGAVLAGRPVHGTVLPVSLARAGALLDGWIERLRPAAILLLGVDERATELKLECAASNVLDFRIPDNDGWQPPGGPILETAPATLATSLPVRAIERALAAAGIPHQRSQDAGRYLCNYVFFRTRALHPHLVAGFVHLPLPAALPIDRQIEAIRLTAEATLASLPAATRPAAAAVA